MKIDIDYNGKKIPTITTSLDMIKHYIDQLLQFPETGHRNRDIEGYQMLIDSRKEENVRVFLKLKHERLYSGEPFRNNISIINYMIENGLWK